MGHEVTIYGYIGGSPWRAGEQFTRTHELNRAALERLPASDEWPHLARGMFSLPAPYPIGTYRTQIIHFGASLKDNPYDDHIWDVFIEKFETLLRTLYWYVATLHLEQELGAVRRYHWIPTQAAAAGLALDPPQPTTEWERSIEGPA